MDWLQFVLFLSLSPRSTRACSFRLFVVFFLVKAFCEFGLLVMIGCQYVSVSDNRCQLVQVSAS